MEIVDGGGEVPEPPAPKVVWPRLVAVGVVVCTAFVLGRVTAPEGITQEQLESERADLVRAERQIEALELALEARREATPPEPTETPAPVETEASGRRVYVVQSGDTMRGIAQMFCGDVDLADFVASFNDIDNPELISVGMELQLPRDCDE